MEKWETISSQYPIDETEISIKQSYVNRKRNETNKTRKIITIKNQTANVLDVDMVEPPLEQGEIAGDAVTAEIMQNFAHGISQATSNCKKSYNISKEAYSGAYSAFQTAQTALANSNHADATSANALSVASDAKAVADNALVQVIENKGSVVYENNSPVDIFYADKKLNKLACQELKELNFDIATTVKIGSFAVNNTSIVVDVTSITSSVATGRLVIACANGLITQSAVFGDESNSLTPLFRIKASSQGDNLVDVYFLAPAMSRVLFEVKCANLVTLTNSFQVLDALPDNASITPINMFDQRLTELKNSIITLTSQVQTLTTEIQNMKTGVSIFECLKANTIDLV